MQQNRPVRVIKRDQSARTEESVKVVTEEGTEASERKLKTVVSGWVREHRQRSEEYRRMFASLLKETGLSPSGTPSRA
jgi:hemerythrin